MYQHKQKYWTIDKVLYVATFSFVTSPLTIDLYI
jgi:hypothetical protein